MERNNKDRAMEISAKASTAYVITISVLCGVIVALTLLLYGAYATANQHATTLEANYQKSYYELVDNINNAELKLSKAIASTDDNYTQKLLTEIGKNAEDAQANLNMLPVNLNGIEESLTFVNQLGGYCTTLAKNLNKGEKLTNEQRSTLKQMHDAVLNMQKSLNKMSSDMWKGYSILNNSVSMNGEYNDFTVSLQSLKAKDVDYPTMIYDGPFSDSQIKKEIKGLHGEEVSMEQAKQNLAKLFDLSADSIKFEGEAKSNFQTYDFSFSIDKNINMYAQMTRIGGKLLTLSSYGDTAVQNMDRDKALEIADAFVKKTGINEVECVWSDVVGGDAYFNFAPIQNGIIIYPDLVKVKVDLEKGVVLGYEAKSYYTNQKDRNLGSFEIASGAARAKVPSEFYIKTEKKVLAPIDFAEILCYEYKCIKNGNIYYFYVDAKTGELVNILRVIQTSDGSKLM